MSKVFSTFDDVVRIQPDWHALERMILDLDGISVKVYATRAGYDFVVMLMGKPKDLAGLVGAGAEEVLVTGRAVGCTYEEPGQQDIEGMALNLRAEIKFETGNTCVPYRAFIWDMHEKKWHLKGGPSVDPCQATEGSCG